MGPGHVSDSVLESVGVRPAVQAVQAQHDADDHLQEGLRQAAPDLHDAAQRHADLRTVRPRQPAILQRGVRQPGGLSQSAAEDVRCCCPVSLR